MIIYQAQIFLSPNRTEIMSSSIDAPTETDSGVSNWARKKGAQDAVEEVRNQYIYFLVQTLQLSPAKAYFHDTVSFGMETNLFLLHAMIMWLKQLLYEFECTSTIYVMQFMLFTHNCNLITYVSHCRQQLI